jgi:hypothetical protein
VTFAYYAAALVAILFALWLTGRRWIVREMLAHSAASEDIIKYHNHLVQYADSGGTDGTAMNEMMMSSTKIERLLGGDNWIVGARVVRNIYNGVPAVPFAIREIHETIQDHLWRREAYQAVELVRNVLIRHVGRRKDEAELLVARSNNPLRCIAIGWRLWAAVPLYLLNAIGLMRDSTVRRTRNSAAFSVYSFILFVAALAGPILSYLADKGAIDAQLRNWLPWR